MAVPRSAWARIGLTLVGAAPGAALLGWFLWSTSIPTADGRWFTLADDAMISMSYGRTLAETGEWVWFPGAERVQGFTNPGWTLYAAALHAIGLEGSAAALAVSLTGVALIAATAGLVTRMTAALFPDDGGMAGAVPLLAGAAVPLLYPLVYWSLRGMEVGLLTLCLVALMLAAVTELSGKPGRGWAITAGLAGVVGVATRVDFAVLGVAVGGVWLTLSTNRRTVGLLGLAPMALTAVGVLVFQRLYFGDWLPNTYHLKMDGVPLLGRLVSGLWGLGKMLPLLVLMVVSWLVIRRLGSRSARAFAALQLSAAAAALSYHVWVGGDSWEELGFANRFLTPLLPGTLVCVGVALAGWIRAGCPGGRRLFGVVVAATAASAFGAGMVGQPTNYFVVLGAGLALAVVLAAAPGLMAVGALAGRRASAVDRTVLVAACMGVVVVACGLIGLGGQTLSVSREIVREYPRVRIGLALAEITSPDASIATFPAGNAGYYAHRRLVDVLGKSDRRVAAAPVRTSLDGVDLGLVPGHNKWELEFSIGQLQPDVVVELWPAPSFVRLVEGYGYAELCTAAGDPAYFRRDSSRVRWTAVRPCTPDELQRATQGITWQARMKTGSP